MTARAARRSASGAPQGQRHRAREAAIQMLYQWEVGRLSMPEVRQTFWSHDDETGEPLSPEMRAFAMRLADGVVSAVDQLDPLIAEAAEHLPVDIIVNVQGDEPFVKKEPLQKLLAVFNAKEGEQVQVASLMQVLKEKRFIEDPNYVKVAVDRNMNSLLFSRSPIPYARNKDISITYYEHIGVYAFRKQALLNFTAWPMTPLESAEKIECLRYLENGVPLKMVITDYMGVEIDTPEDLERAARLLQ